MQPLTISKQTARRFVMGKQGLWPGRRWAGRQGVADALGTIEALQLDPLNVVARSHDIALYSRVLDYRPEQLAHLLYSERAAFDYGGALFVYPITELPYWATHMARWRDEPRYKALEEAHPGILAEVRAALAERGPLGNRDFTGRTRVNSYRGRKDSALGLYYLWLTGEVMVHHRDNFQRFYDLRERIVPPQSDKAATEAEAETYFAIKAVNFVGLSRETGWRNSLAYYLHRPVDRDEGRRRLAQMVDDGMLVQVQIEGSKELHHALTADVPLLSTLEGGRIPDTWRPLATTTEEEAVILAPLEIVSARGRAARLFDFEYLWEVYKPVEQRRWGYYTVPVLYGDRLVARLDPRLDRKAQTLHINGFWLEDDKLRRDGAWWRALGRGLARFAAFAGARDMSADAIDAPGFKAHRTQIELI